MTDVIIGVAVLVVASIIMKVGKSLGKATANGHGHSENFPFPKTTFDEMSEENEDEEEDWLGRVKDEVVIVESRNVSANSMQQAALAREMAKVVQRPAVKVELGARRKEEAEFEVFDFDIQKAIIYAEIIQPKFMEY